MKKFLSFTVATALALGFAACSNEESVVAPQSSQGTDMYVQFTVTLPSSSSTRADEEYTSSETTGQYVVGNDNEYYVSDVYVYYAKDDNSIIQIDGKPYQKLGVKSVGKGNVTENEGGGQKWETLSCELPKSVEEALKDGENFNTCTVYLLCNKPVETATSVSDLLGAEFDYTVDDEAIQAAGLPMTARSIQGDISESLTPSKSYTQENPAKLSFEVERSLARIAYTNTTTEFPLYTYSKDPSSTAVNNGTNDGYSEVQIGKVKLLKYYVINEANKYYAYRRVGNIGEDASISFADGTENSWGFSNLYGPITSTNKYVIDPQSKKKFAGTFDLTLYHHPMSYAYRHYSAFKDVEPATAATATSDLQPSCITYVAENVMTKKAQTKGQATGIIFEVQIVPDKVYTEDGEDGVAYTEGDDIYYYNDKFYKNIAAVNKWENTDAITAVNYTTYGIKKYKKGIAFYEYFIRHDNNNKYTDMGDLEFAIIRNNSYELSIAAAAMTPYTTIKPGTDPVDPDPDPEDPDDNDPDEPTPTYPDPNDPDDPDAPDPGEDVEDATLYLKVNVVVRPWIVRSNAIILGQ